MLFKNLCMFSFSAVGPVVRELLQKLFLMLE